MNAPTRTPTPLNWHHTPVVRRLLDRLTPDNVELVKQVSIPCDFYKYGHTDAISERTLSALNEIRTVSIEEEFGSTFEEASAAGRGLDYIATDERAPTVTAVIKEAFAARRKVAA